MIVNRMIVTSRKGVISLGFDGRVKLKVISNSNLVKIADVLVNLTTIIHYLLLFYKIKVVYFVFKSLKLQLTFVAFAEESQAKICQNRFEDKAKSLEGNCLIYLKFQRANKGLLLPLSVNVGTIFSH